MSDEISNSLSLTIKRDGEPLRLSYADSGSGSPLILLGGLGMENEGWVQQAGFLSEHFRVIAVEHRGSGLSDVPTGPYSISMMVADLFQFLERLGLKKVHLVGLSMGGMVALEFACVHSGLISTLVLAHTAARLSPKTRFILNLWSAMKKAGVEREIQFRSQLPWLLPERFFAASEVIDAIVKQQMKQLKIQSVAGFVSQVAACCAFDGHSYLEKISAPTLVLGAKDDQLVTGKELEELAAGIPQAKSVLFESGGHLGFSLEHQRFNREVLNFIPLQGSDESYSGNPGR